MGEERPDKERMRQLWVDAVVAAGGNADGPPFYLTLAGAQGLDVKRMVDYGLVVLPRMAERSRLRGLEGSGAGEQQ